MVGFKQFRKDEPPATAPVKHRRAHQMNKSEIAYSLVLEAMKRTGQIVSYDFEGVKLKLAEGTYYTPDFFVVRCGQNLGGAMALSMECHEVKGFMREAARVRLNVAAAKYPQFTFKLCRLKKGDWVRTEVPR